MFKTERFYKYYVLYDRQMYFICTCRTVNLGFSRTFYILVVVNRCCIYIPVYINIHYNSYYSGLWYYCTQGHYLTQVVVVLKLILLVYKTYSFFFFFF